MFVTRVLNVIKKHTNEFTGFVKESPDRKWGRRKVKMMTAHFYGRGRNCYRLAIRQMNKGLEHHTKNRVLSRQDFRGRHKYTCSLIYIVLPYFQEYSKFLVTAN